MIKIEGLTAKQHVIADLLWKADTTEELVAIMLAFGKEEVCIVKEMIIAATYDSMDVDVSEANEYLDKFRVG